jgi:saccharopine dehydrogenase-like NADP-dependent oxidoreductase
MVLKFAVLGGAGAIGRIVVRDLFESSRSNHILIADFGLDSSRSLARTFRSPRVTAAQADASNVRELAKIIHDCSIVINCTNHRFNLKVMEAALQARVHYLDLGGLFTWTRRQLRLNDRFRKAGLTAILGMGCAPGITNVMAAEIASQMKRVESIRIRVGSIDFNATPGAFAFPYSAQTIVEELTLSSWKFSAGRFVESAPRQGWELVDFGKPVGKAWVVMTRHSEIATLPLRFKKRGLRYADFKVGFDRPFVRELMRRIRRGATLRDFQAIPASRQEPNDYEITRVIVRGEERTTTMDLHAKSKPEWHASAGDVNTACPASIVAQMIASGRIADRGVFAPEDIVPRTEFFNELSKRELIRGQTGN